MEVGARVKCRSQAVGHYYNTMGTVTAEINDKVKVFFDSEYADKLTEHQKLALSFWFFKHELELVEGEADA